MTLPKKTPLPPDTNPRDKLESDHIDELYCEHLNQHEALYDLKDTIY